MAATSIAGHDNGRASAGHLQQKVEWDRHSPIALMATRV
jgi:hypothetical protein